MQIWIGTSGFSYPDWGDVFYPHKLNSRQMLGYYAQHFPLVELNFTFYQPPTRTALARLADRVPAAFQFLVKLPRGLSHEHDPSLLPPFRQALDELQNRSQLMGLLCQLPQALHRTRQEEQWLEFLRSELAGHYLAVEYRHRSWFEADVSPWMAEKGLDLVAVDVPDLDRLYPRGLVQSGPRLYVRFHSRNASNWYQSDKDRYDYSYNDLELMSWMDSIAQAAPASESARLLFNNCHRGQAAENAHRLRELLRERMQQDGDKGLFELVEPFAVPPEGTTQGLLFD